MERRQKSGGTTSSAALEPRTHTPSRSPSPEQSRAPAVEAAPSSSDKRFPLSAFIKCLSQRCLAAPSPFLEKGRALLLLLYK